MARERAIVANELDKVDPVWARIREEAEEVARREAELATFIYSTVLHHDTLEAAVVHRVSERLDHPDVSAELIRQAYGDALEGDPEIGMAFRADIVAFFDRDPATREPDQVAADVADGLITRDTAERQYRVALAADGALDRAATARLRAV